MSEDRPLPHEHEAERAVLGCILLAPGDCLAECAERWGSTRVFYDLRHQVIYDAAMRLANAGKAVDLVTLTAELARTEDLERVGGRPVIASIPDWSPHESNLGHYADLVWGAYQRRSVIKAATEISVHAFEGVLPADELLTRAEERVFSLPRARDRGAVPIGDHCQAVVDRCEHYCRGIGTVTGLRTGFTYWDRLASGLQNSELIVLGGRPGTGKTSLAMNIAERVAMDGGHPVGIQSLEMSSLDLTLRLACARSEVNFHKLRTGCATHGDLQKIAVVLPKVKKAPIYIDDSTGLTIFDLRSRLRTMKQRFKIRLAIVDYLQLVTLPPEYRGDVVRGYGEVAKGLMASAKELEIPIICLSQLSREGEKRGGAPRMSDLRESGDIEAAAHFIAILYKEKLEPDEEAEIREQVLKDPCGNIDLKMLLEVCKNRNGPSGTAMQFLFKRWCMRFEDRHNPSKVDRDIRAEEEQKIHDEDVPRNWK